MKMLTLASCPDWSPFSADISICFVVDGGSAASVWVGRVIITFIHNLCRTTLRC